MSNQALDKAASATEALYLARDTYFPANPDDKIAKLKAESDLALNLLDSIPPGNNYFWIHQLVGTASLFVCWIWISISFSFGHLPEQRKLPTQRATYEYLRGKILDVLPDYKREAEDHLSKAVSNFQ